MAKYKINDKLQKYFPPVEQDVALLKREIEALWRIHESLGERQLQQAQQLLDTIGAGLDGRPKAEI